MLQINSKLNECAIFVYTMFRQGSRLKAILMNQPGIELKKRKRLQYYFCRVSSIT